MTHLSKKKVTQANKKTLKKIDSDSITLSEISEIDTDFDSSDPEDNNFYLTPSFKKNKKTLCKVITGFNNYKDYEQSLKQRLSQGSKKYSTSLIQIRKQMNKRPKIEYPINLDSLKKQIPKFLYTSKEQEQQLDNLFIKLKRQKYLERRELLRQIRIKKPNYLFKGLLGSREVDRVFKLQPNGQWDLLIPTRNKKNNLSATPRSMQEGGGKYFIGPLKPSQKMLQLIQDGQPVSMVFKFESDLIGPTRGDSFYATLLVGLEKQQLVSSDDLYSYFLF